MWKIALFGLVIINNIFTVFLAGYLLNRSQNNKKRFKWRIIEKLETSFLSKELSTKEIKNGEIDGDEKKAIKSFKKHFGFFQNHIIENGYNNKRISKKLKGFIEDNLRPFLVKWENKVDLDSKEVYLNKKEKSSFMEDVKNLQIKTRKFIEEIK